MFLGETCDGRVAGAAQAAAGPGRARGCELNSRASKQAGRSPCVGVTVRGEKRPWPQGLSLQKDEAATPEGAKVRKEAAQGGGAEGQLSSRPTPSAAGQLVSRQRAAAGQQGRELETTAREPLSEEHRNPKTSLAHHSERPERPGEAVGKPRQPADVCAPRRRSRRGSPGSPSRAGEG